MSVYLQRSVLIQAKTGQLSIFKYNIVKAKKGRRARQVKDAEAQSDSDEADEKTVHLSGIFSGGSVCKDGRTSEGRTSTVSTPIAEGNC